MKALFAVSACALALALAVPSPAGQSAATAVDNFEGYSTGVVAEGSSIGGLYVASSGGGTTSITVDKLRPNGNKQTLDLLPAAGGTASVTSLGSYTKPDVQVQMKTVRQLSGGDTSTGAILFQYNGTDSYYYFQLTVSGWVLGKVTPGGSSVVADGTSVSAHVGTYNKVRVQMAASQITVTVNGHLIAQVKDTVGTLKSGYYALVASDSEVRFDDLTTK